MTSIKVAISINELTEENYPDWLQEVKHRFAGEVKSLFLLRSGSTVAELRPVLLGLSATQQLESKSRDGEVDRNVAMVANRGRRHPSAVRLAENQCARCKKFGHWKYECGMALKEKGGRERIL
jgi:hypothetical protein